MREVVQFAARRVYRSISEAVRAQTAVKELDLTSSQDLLCVNLLCEKVGDPCICRISRVLESLEHLEKLSLRNNRLASLPPGLFTLPALRELDLSQNDLSELPQDVALLQSLEVLCLVGNPRIRLEGFPASELSALPALRAVAVDPPLRAALRATGLPLV